jgi:hypothetical protein
VELGSNCRTFVRSAQQDCSDRYIPVACSAQSLGIALKSAQAHLDSRKKLARVRRHPAQRRLVTQQDWMYSDLSPYLRFLTAAPGPWMLPLSHRARVWVLVRSRDHRLEHPRRLLRLHRRTHLFLLRADNSDMMDVRVCRWEVKADRRFRLESAWWMLWRLLIDGRAGHDDAWDCGCMQRPEIGQRW